MGIPAHRLLILTSLAAAGTLAGCSSRPNPEQPGQSVSIRGRLTAEGVECPAMRDDNDRLYTLLGDLKGAKPGDRVAIEGTIVAVSFCMQGTTLELERIEKVR